MNRALCLILSIFNGLLIAEARANGNGKDDNPPANHRIPDTILIDSIAVHKAARELQVFCNNELVKSYKVHLGQAPVGRKECQGDMKTPEGCYRIEYKNHYSQFYKSLKISYPNANDVAQARKLGKSPGGDVMIHGLPNYDANVGPDRYQNDWTWGCIAVRNEEIEEIFSHVEAGIPIMITP